MRRKTAHYYWVDAFMKEVGIIVIRSAGGCGPRFFPKQSWRTRPRVPAVQSVPDKGVRNPEYHGVRHVICDPNPHSSDRHLELGGAIYTYAPTV